MLVLSCSIDTGALKKMPNWLSVNRGLPSGRMMVWLLPSRMGGGGGK